MSMKAYPCLLCGETDVRGHSLSQLYSGELYSGELYSGVSGSELSTVIDKFPLAMPPWPSVTTNDAVLV